MEKHSNQITDDIPYFIDGIDLDRSNEEFNIALDLAMNTHYSMYITGRTGTGKSTFLKYLDMIAGKLAPTGVAAINAGGHFLLFASQFPKFAYSYTNSLKRHD